MDALRDARRGRKPLGVKCANGVGRKGKKKKTKALKTATLLDVLFQSGDDEKMEGEVNNSEREFLGFTIDEIQQVQYIILCHMCSYCM